MCVGMCVRLYVGCVCGYEGICVCVGGVCEGMRCVWTV